MKVPENKLRVLMAGGVFLSMIVLLQSSIAFGQSSWLGSAWRFRVPVTVSVGAYDRLDMPAEVQINFTQLMSGFSFSGTFIENSLRVVEVDGTGAIIDTTIGWQFDKDSDYNASSKASGTLVVVAKGTTTSGSTRTYHVYFQGGSGSFPAPQVNAQVSLTDNIQDEGQACFQVQANGNTYYFQKQGGGYSSLVDANGNDWIGFHPGVGTHGDGEWRGVPNCGPAFHPGYSNSTSSIVHTGPVKAAFRAVGVTASGKTYDCLWEIYPRFARMTMTRADSNYWFLYEGTPGGGTDPSTMFMYRSDGTQTTLTSSWNGDIASNEWVYFSNPNEISGGRSIFVAHAEDDAATDTYWPMYPSSGWADGHMTVFGFGRDNPGDHWLLTGAPQHFTMGLMDGTQFAASSKIVYGSYKPMTVSAGAAEQQQQIAAPTIVSPTYGATGLSSNVQLSWTSVVGATAYRVQVSLDSTLSSALALDDSSITDVQTTVTGLHAGAVYFWRVKASGTVAGPWSSTSWFSTALSAPGLSDPSNGATVSSLTPTLNWASVQYATGYRLQVSTDPNFTLGMIVDEWNAGVTSRTLPALTEATTYYWRAASRTTQVTSPFSGSWSFRTPQVMVAPSTLQPLNGATGLSTSEIFRWTKVAGAVSYHLQVATDSNFAGGFVKNDSTIVDTFRTVLGLAKGTRYYWRVQAKIGTTDGPFSSPVWSFLTAYQLPSQAVLLSPVGGSQVNTDTVAFRWTKAQPNVTRYWLEVGMDSTFSFSLLDSSVVDTTGKVYIPVRSMTYYWRVRGANLGGWGPFSSVETFYADITGSVRRENGLPTQLSLDQNYPNPFNPTSRIRFALPSEKQVRIEVYSVLGERVATLVDERLSAGVYTVEVDGTRMSSGVYYYRLVTGETSITKKMLLVK